MFPWPSHVWSVTDELWHRTHRWPKDAEARSWTHPHMYTSRGGLLLPENEIPFCPPTDHNVLRFACVNECSPIACRLNTQQYCTFILFILCKISVIPRKKSADFFPPSSFSISHPAPFHVYVSVFEWLLPPPLITLLKRQCGQENT